VRMPVPYSKVPTLAGGEKKRNFTLLRKEERRRKGFVKLMVCDV